MNDVLKFLGLLFKGNQLVIGENLIPALGRKKVALVIIAKDISENSKKLYMPLIEKNKVQTIYIANKDELAHAIGKGNVVAIGVINQKASKSILEKVKNMEVK